MLINMLRICYILPIFYLCIWNGKLIKLTNSIITNDIITSVCNCDAARRKGGTFSLPRGWTYITPFLWITIKRLLSSIQSTNAPCYRSHRLTLLQKVLPQKQCDGLSSKRDFGHLRLSSVQSNYSPWYIIVRSHLQRQSFHMRNILFSGWRI